jgi:Fe-S-cluster containining protein
MYAGNDPLAAAVLEKYHSLAALIDSHSEKTTASLKDEIVCGPGCDDCCLLSSVSAVEAQVIMEYTALHKIAALKNDKCPFLNGGLCSIYPARPVICRTHGLPVMIDGEAHSCEKNFTGSSDIGPEFILDLDTVNSHLAAVNLAWIKVTGSGGADGRVFLIDCGFPRQL